MFDLTEPPTPDPALARLAWDHLVTTGEIKAEYLRPLVARAWHRSYQNGCRPHEAQLVRVSESETAKLIEKERSLVESARPFLVALSRLAADRPHVATLADRNGSVLDVIRRSASDAIADATVPGLVVSEARLGANGVGTAIAESEYVEIVGPEHYAAPLQYQTCQAIPLRGGDGTLRGALSLSVRTLGPTPHVREVLFCALHAVQDSLWAEGLAHRVRTLTSESDRNAMELLRQDLIQLHAASRLRFELAARRLSMGRPAQETMTIAHDLAARFRRRATVWLELVDGADDPAVRLDLADCLVNLCELFETELRISGITVELTPLRALKVRTRKKRLMKELMATFLSGLAWAGQGGRVRLGVVPRGPATPAPAVQLRAVTARTGRPLAVTVQVDAAET